MRKKALLFAPALVLSLVALSAGPALASTEGGGDSYGGTLNEINNSGATGEAFIEINGTEATVTVTASGLAETFMDAPFPHVQHIHIAAQGVCPDESADENGDGIINTTEGQPFYGAIGTTLSTGDADKSPAAGVDLTVAPSGSTTDYSETFEMNAETLASLAAGTGVIVVHGFDPATQPDPEAALEDSDLVPALPLAATSPALCGVMAIMPAGSPDTGAVTQTGAAGGLDGGLLTLGGLLAAVAAAGVYLVARRQTSRPMQ